MFEDFKMDMKMELNGIFTFKVDNPFKRRELDSYIEEFTELLAEVVAFEDDNADYIMDLFEDADGKWHINSFSYEPVVDFQVVAIKVERPTDNDFKVHYIVYTGEPEEAVKKYIQEHNNV